MKSYVLIATSFGAIVVSGHCSAIAPTFEVKVETPARPVVSGKTNLPDGTELMVRISRTPSNYSAGTKVKVANGAFRSEQFSQHGDYLNPGTYKVEISMPGAPLQTDAVRAVIGMKGEKLSGPLVRKGIVGKVVDYSTTFSVGRGRSETADQTARSKEALHRARWVQESCRDIVHMTNPNAAAVAKMQAQAKCVREVSSKK